MIDARSQLQKHLKELGGFESQFGFINIEQRKPLGEGGSGLVYSANIGDKQLAVKFLTTLMSKKKTRFQSEFFNYQFVCDKLYNTVHLFHYDTIQCEDIETPIPYVLMRKYKSSLKGHKVNNSSAFSSSFEELESLFLSLAKTIKSYQEFGIIHRDLKPENILIEDDNTPLVTDFGISHFDTDIFPLDNKTEKGERLANFEFSAPEQIQGGVASFASDLYSLAQIIYWCAFGELNRGTGGKSFTSQYSHPNAYYLDIVISKCLHNSPNERYSTASTLLDDYKAKCATPKEVNPYDDMHKFSNILRSVSPECYRYGSYISDKKDICFLIDKLMSTEFNRSLRFSTGSSWNDFDCFKHLYDDNYLLDIHQFCIANIWLLTTDNMHNDLMIIETALSSPYLIDEREHYGVAVINNDLIIPLDNINSGYIRYKGEVVSTDDVSVEQRTITDFPNERYYVIGTYSHCSMAKENDSILDSLQSKVMTTQVLQKCGESIKKNLPRECKMYL